MHSTDLEQVRLALGSRYAIERELGRGGMGVVYLARDLRLDRAVALKVLPPEFAADSALRERFLRETRTSASFSHPNIVPVHAVEESDALVAFAMGYVEGESLAERVRRLGPLGVRDLVRLLQDVGYALAYAHGRGVVHRDIKPDNVMIERATGRAQLMDFGIARAITTASAATASAGLTRVGEVVGTPEYMSPEQASGDAIDGRSDLYSLGLVAYFAASGRVMMAGATPQRVFVRQLTESLPPVGTERTDLPPALAAAIDRCLCKEAEDRFASAEALVEAIDAAQLGAPEIPISVRGLAQEVGTLTMVVFFITVIGWLIVGNAPDALSRLDTLLPLVFVFGVVMARTLQTRSAVRRVAELGFPHDEIMRGLRATVDENAQLREQVRRNPVIQRARRRTIIAALVQLPLAVGMIRIAMLMRTEIRPGLYSNSPPGITLVISGLLLLGISFVLLARSPFRMPPGERVFRLLWLGPAGRWFIRISTRGVAPMSAASRASGSASMVSRSAITSAATPTSASPVLSTGSTSNDTSVQTLDDRVTALEQWRSRTGS